MDYAAKSDREVGIQIESTVCHLGERAGNADIFPIAARLFNETKDLEVPVTWQFNPQMSASIASVVMGFAGLEVHRQNAIVGEDINAHRSGIHSDGIIKGGHRIYTPHNPTFWGHAEEARHEEGIYQGANGRRAIAEQRK
jgi:isopropylmalate/homocitrate/citramalate synthase